jgi:transposase
MSWTKTHFRRPKLSLLPAVMMMAREFDIRAKLLERGYGRETFFHGELEFARGEDGDGFYVARVNTIERFWSLMSPRRSVLQGPPTNHTGFFEFARDVRKRGKAILGSFLMPSQSKPMDSGIEPISSVYSYNVLKYRAEYC